MATPEERIGKAKGKLPAGLSGVTTSNYKFPDNVGDASSGGQHFMLIRAYDFSDPAMTSGKTFRPKTNDKDNVELVPVVWTAALFIPPAALKQVYSAKYSTLDYAGAAATAAGDERFGQYGAGRGRADRWWSRLGCLQQLVGRGRGGRLGELDRRSH